jgi:hypothetical protein
VLLAPFLIVLGAGLGYLAGAITAGCFLITNALEKKSPHQPYQPSAEYAVLPTTESNDIVIAEVVSESVKAF